MGYTLVVHEMPMDYSRAVSLFLPPSFPPAINGLTPWTFHEALVVARGQSTGSSWVAHGGCPWLAHGHPISILWDYGGSSRAAHE